VFKVMWGWSEDHVFEVTQRSSLALIEAFDSGRFRGEAAWTTFAWQIGRNKALQYVRERKNLAMASGVEADEGHPVELADPGVGPEQQAHDRAYLERLLTDVAKLLTPREHEFLLCFHETQSISGVAMRMEIGEAHAHVLLHTVRGKLKKVRAKLKDSE